MYCYSLAYFVSRQRRLEFVRFYNAQWKSDIQNEREIHEESLSIETW
jgi:hypothetical protein